MNYCYLNPEGGPIDIHIFADNGARSNWNFAHAVKKEDRWTALEVFKLNSGDDGKDSQTLEAENTTIDNTSLLWKVTACGMIVGAERAKFSIIILQDDVEIYKKISDRKIPQCQDNKAIVFKGIVEFKFHSNNIENIDPWDVLSS